MQPESALFDELLERIRRVIEPTRVTLFGSAARQEMRPDSDLDVLVVVRDDVDCRDAARRIYRFLIGFPVAVDVVVATETDILNYGNSYGLVYYPALREGKELYAA